MVDKIFELRDLGLSIRAIADKLGISKSKVGKIVKNRDDYKEVVDIETNEVVKAKIRYEEKLYHFIKSIDGSVDTNMFYNLLMNSEEDFIKSVSKQTIKLWSKKKSYIDLDSCEMEWLYDLYHEQSKTTYRLKTVGGIRVVSGMDFYGTDRFKGKSDEIMGVIVKFKLDGFSKTMNEITNLEATEENAPMKFFYLPIAIVLWSNYGERCLEEWDSLPMFIYYRTKGEDSLPSFMKKLVTRQYISNEAIVPKKVIDNWGTYMGATIDDCARFMSNFI